MLIENSEPRSAATATAPAAPQRAVAQATYTHLFAAPLIHCIWKDAAALNAVHIRGDDDVGPRRSPSGISSHGESKARLPVCKKGRRLN
jgi:hypothetical protein